MDVKLKARNAPRRSVHSSSPLYLQPKMRKTDPEFERQLRDLVSEAQNNPPGSEARQRALTRLILAIHQADCLSRLRRHASRHSQDVFADLYDEARAKLQEHICKKIDDYKPEKGEVMPWVNTILHYKFIEVCNERWPKNTLSCDPITIEQTTPWKSSESREREYQELRQFLNGDPEGHLAAHYIRNRPDVTFQVLAIERSMHGKTWKELKSLTGIAIQTLSCFHNRTLQKLLPYFRRYL